MRIQLWLRLNLNIKSSAEPCLWERAFLPAEIRRGRSWQNFGVWGGEGGTKHKVGLTWVLSWSRSIPGSCDGPAGTQAALEGKEDTCTRRGQWDCHPRAWLAFCSGAASESGGEVEQRGPEATGWGWEPEEPQAPFHKPCRAAELPSPLLLPISSLDKWVQIAFLRFSRAPEGPRTRPADGFQRACLCFLTSRLNLMSHLKC